MASSKYPDALSSPEKASVVREGDIEDTFVAKLRALKYSHRPDITNRASLEQNFREKFEELNRVRLADSEFARLLDEIVTPDVFTAAKTLRQINSFTRDDGTPLNYSLVNLKDWCKNHFEVISQLLINTDSRARLQRFAPDARSTSSAPTAHLHTSLGHRPRTTTHKPV